MEKNVLHNLPPPWETTPKGHLANMSTEEEVRAMKRSEIIAQQILESRQGVGDSPIDISYNEFIHQMRRRGIANEFSNIALADLGFRPGPDAQLVSAG